MSSWFKSCENVYCYDFVSRDPIRSQFCTLRQLLLLPHVQKWVSIWHIFRIMISWFVGGLGPFSFLLHNNLAQNWLFQQKVSHMNISTISFSVSWDLHIGSTTTYLPMHELCILTPESSRTRQVGRDPPYVIWKGYQFYFWYLNLRKVHV